MVHDDQPPVRESLHRMSGVTGHDCNQTGLYEVGYTVHIDLQFTLDHFVNLFLGMKMLMDRGAACEVVMREGHVGRVKKRAFQPGNLSITFKDLVSTRGTASLLSTPIDCSPHADEVSSVVARRCIERVVCATTARNFPERRIRGVGPRQRRRSS